ncbi:MAG: DUF47 domain-containing protein [Nitrososphaerales archaeon]
MVTLKDIFNFVSRGEEKVLERVVSNLDISIETSRHLLDLVNALKKHDYDAVEREYEEISSLEDKGDELHRSLVRKIATGSFFGGIREDLLNLLGLIDNIADEAKDAAKVFHQRRIPKETIDYLFKEDVASFVSACIEAAEILRRAILALEKDKAKVLTLTEKTEESEERADTIRYKIIQNLLKNEINANVLDIVMLKDFLNIADGVADSAEHGSDVLQVLVAKGYS